MHTNTSIGDKKEKSDSSNFKKKYLKQLKEVINNVNPGIPRIRCYELFNHCQICNERTLVKIFLIIIGAIAVALAGWALYLKTPIIDLIIKIGFTALVVLVVCAILGAAGINPFKSERDNLR